MFLGELEQSVKTIKGVGPASAKDLSNLGILTIKDLLTHYPRNYEYRDELVPFFPKEENLVLPRKVTTVADIIAQDYFGFGKKKTLKVYVKDESGTASLLCFGRNFLAAPLSPGKKIFLTGTFQYKYQELQSGSFEFEEYSENPKFFNRVLPVYPLSGKLTQGFIRSLLGRTIRTYAEHLESELPETLMAKRGLIPKALALKNIHFPKDRETLEKAKRTLAYEELFFFQLLLRQLVLQRGEKRRAPRQLGNELESSCISRLPFSLTEDQVTVLEEIKADLSSPGQMNRLLQGDVGSGKTLVAFLAALSMIEKGYQAAFLAPTELLAKQHAENAARLLEPIGITPTLLTGATRGERRKTLLHAIREGKTELILGTHALFSENTEYDNLGLIIVDEQHRFGVLQRTALTRKGETPDILMMTATPIPRSLALTAFGDLDISTIRSLPPGRKPSITHLAVQGREKKVYDWVKRELNKGRQAYFVYPLISPSDRVALKDVESMYRILKEREFPNRRLGLIHSRLNEAEREETMSAFALGKLDILFATSVVEVGVDVPNATCMVVEHAERFGLAALHQLRGRVGRGLEQSYAFLIYSPDLTEDGKERLKVMMETNDGFVIAEADLHIRGPGEVIGTRQSGYIPFSIAEISTDMVLLKEAKEDAAGISEEDPRFSFPQYAVLARVLKKTEPFSGFF